MLIPNAVSEQFLQYMIGPYSATNKVPLHVQKTSNMVAGSKKAFPDKSNGNLFI